MSEIKNEVGQLIKQARLSVGLTQKELGEKIEVAESTFSRFENGNQNLTIDTLQKIATALNKRLIIKLE
ncbi:helix-turn-helix domain-containing protein [Larkinella humicola]|uniref:Helix-turn-helix transcriptional regulator n=1 Tax=Larkinella humicola TaxID=2607654 RepID=A0A5N1JGI2_9BACT|nr:helix-turn-helix transcriptional regulator [Larkinella humicola]KAA9349740.1 helix-turn-helix transcriptional regulator [Larkinella humicola]